jgi:hypothetical protein
MPDSQRSAHRVPYRGARWLGMVLNRSLAASEPQSNVMEEDSIFRFARNSLSGTAYLTQPESSNPIYGGRNLDALYADEYLPGELPGRSADLPTIQLPQAESGRVDRDIVIEVITARLGEQGIQWYCGNQP